MSNYSLATFNQVMQRDTTLKFLGDTLSSKKETFVSNLTTLVANNVSLQNCEPYSIMYAALKATALELPLDSNLGHAYVIPFKNNSKGGIYEAQFQIGYKGFIQLAIRSGQYTRINVTDVREGEIIGYDIATGEIKIKEYANLQEMEERNSKAVVGYLAYFKLINGFEKYSFWCNDKIDKHVKRYSKSYDHKNSVYKTNQPEMYAKTVLKNHLNKWGILSIEMQDAIKYDQAVIGENSVDYVDNAIDNPANPEDNDKVVNLLTQAFDELTPEQQKASIAELEADIIQKQQQEFEIVE